ncbi:hypothetical protein OPQ81_011808 [Rhizoctonia solani]|nr:hypothetical protein OPQ81_011808 [Rhizoctonia solani]
MSIPPEISYTSHQLCIPSIFDRLVMNQPDGFHLHPEDSECSYMFVPLEYTLAFLQYGLDDKPIATHTHPFTSLPLIRSHIHPYFAICNTAEKVASLGQAKIDHLDIPIDMRRALNQCKLIYSRWMPSKPTKQRSVPNQSNSLPPKPSDPKPKPSNTSAGTNRDTPFGSQPSGRWMRSQRRGNNTPPYF